MADLTDLDRFAGMMTMAELELLARFASWVRRGDIVEIGSWRGRSAVALARGAAEAERVPAGSPPAMVYCVEPHKPFTGVKGGAFGASDRTAFYETMLATDSSEKVALVNMTSLDAARGWSGKVALLFIDGDHSEAAVQADIDAWTAHLVDGAAVLFHDALDAGPASVIDRLLKSGMWRKAAAADGLVALRRVVDEERRAYWARFAEARAALAKKATEAGYEPERAMTRLAYGTFVSVPRRYMYMETPKAACTSFKHMIAEQEQARIDPAAPPYLRETRRDMLIHQRNLLPIPTLLDCDEEAREAILTAAPDWFVFAVVRNPFSRVVSVFENKVLLGEPGYRPLWERFGDLSSFGGYRQAFAAFVREVVADPALREGDAHLAPQVSLILPRLIPYTAIFRLERIAEAVDAFHVHLREVGATHQPAILRHNPSRHSHWQACYDEGTAAIVADAYREDLEAFGYDSDDWRLPDGKPSELADSPIDLYWRSEIAERNAFIDYLYTHVG